MAVEGARRVCGGWEGAGRVRAWGRASGSEVPNGSPRVGCHKLAFCPLNEQLPCCRFIVTTVTHGADHVNAPLSLSFPGARVVRAPSGPDFCDQYLLINRHAQARLKGRLASLRHPLDCKNLTFLSTGAGGQHDREGQSWSSTADPYIRRPGWHRQQARAALSASLGLVRAAGSAKQLSRQNQNVQEAAQATPDRAWPWALIPARPPPTRPLPDRPRRPQSTFQNH